MTLPAFASIDDYEARYGTVADPIRAQAALERASTLIRVEANTGWVNEEGTAVDFGDMNLWLRDAIVDICVEAARRALDTPAGVSSETETIGDTTHAVTYDDPTGNVYLRAAERATIRRAAGRRGVHTIATTREDPVSVSDLGTIDPLTGTIYADVDGGALIPWLDRDQLT